MTEAQELLKCERCAVYLLDLDCCEAVSPFLMYSASNNTTIPLFISYLA